MTCLSTGSGVVNDSLLDRKSNKPGETSITLDLDNDLVLSRNHSHLHKMHKNAAWSLSIQLNPLTAPGFEVFLTHPMLSTAPAHPAEHVVPQDPSKRPCSWHAPSTFVPRMFNSEKRIFPCFHGCPAENLKWDPCLNGRKSTTITYVQLCLAVFFDLTLGFPSILNCKGPIAENRHVLTCGFLERKRCWNLGDTMGHGDTCKVGVWNGSVTPQKKTAHPAFGDYSNYMTCWRQSRLHPSIKHSEQRQKRRDWTGDCFHLTPDNTLLQKYDPDL